jgi:hypothetical protein
MWANLQLRLMSVQNGIDTCTEIPENPDDIPEGCENASDNPKPDWDVQIIFRQGYFSVISCHICFMASSPYLIDQYL